MGLTRSVCLAVWLWLDQRRGVVRRALQEWNVSRSTLHSKHRLFYFIFIFPTNNTIPCHKGRTHFLRLLHSCELSWSCTKHEAIHLWCSSSLATTGVWKFNLTHTLALDAGCSTFDSSWIDVIVPQLTVCIPILLGCTLHGNTSRSNWITWMPHKQCSMMGTDK